MRLLLLFALAVFPLPSAAQGAAPDPAVSTITADDLGRRIRVIADDSMQGRDTPSPGLERAAAYIISEFQRLGLQPAGEDGYVQRFGVSRWTVDTAGSAVQLLAPGAVVSLPVGREARYIGGALEGRDLGGRVVLLAGPVTREGAGSARLRDRIIFLVLDYSGALSAGTEQRVGEIVAAGPRAVLILSNRDSATFASRLEVAQAPRFGPDFRDAANGPPVVEIHERRLGPVLRAAGIDPERLRALRQPVLRNLSQLRASVRLSRRYLERASAPNLLARLEGSDSALRAEHVVYSAHLDHIGLSPGRADSINNGADDNASGVAGLLEIAEAFAREGPRPRRSLLFFVPSGEEKGLWGSAYFVERPTVPLDRLVADINQDLVGRNWTDSVIVVGPELGSLGGTLTRVVAAHPELRMHPLADRWPEERIFYRSDHYNFARKGVPVLFFTSGTHPDYHQPTDVADRIDTEKQARLTRLLYYLGAEVANDPERPRWWPGRHRQTFPDN